MGKLTFRADVPANDPIFSEGHSILLPTRSGPRKPSESSQLDTPAGWTDEEWSLFLNSLRDGIRRQFGLIDVDDGEI